MITCKVSCPLYANCKDRAEWKRCIYDYGIKKEHDDDHDEFLERMTY